MSNSFWIFVAGIGFGGTVKWMLNSIAEGNLWRAVFEGALTLFLLHFAHTHTKENEHY